MYTLNKNEIEMDVTTIHNAYPDAPEAAMEAMRERFTEIILEDNFLAEVVLPEEDGPDIRTNLISSLFSLIWLAICCNL